MNSVILWAMLLGVLYVVAVVVSAALAVMFLDRDEDDDDVDVWWYEDLCDDVDVHYYGCGCWHYDPDELECTDHRGDGEADS